MITVAIIKVLYNTYLIKNSNYVIKIPLNIIIYLVVNIFGITMMKNHK